MYIGVILKTLKLKMSVQVTRFVAPRESSFLYLDFIKIEGYSSVGVTPLEVNFVLHCSRVGWFYRLFRIPSFVSHTYIHTIPLLLPLLRKK